MKILLILHYPPPLHGASMVGEFIKSSVKINSRFETKHINLSTSNSVTEIGKNGLIKWWRYSIILYKTFLESIQFKPDLIYITLSTTGPGLYKDSLVALICKLLKFKIVYHLHNKGVERNSNKIFNNFLYQLLFSNSNVILLSPYLYSDVSKYVPKDKVDYCSNGIPEIKIKGRINNSNITNKESINLLFLSNLIKTKGIWDLLNSCKILKDRGINFHCSIAGAEGDFKAVDIKTFIDKNNLQKQIIYLGKVSGKEKEKAFKEADVFIHPTLEDCFPLVLLEAMQYKLPSISTLEGAIPEIIIDQFTGILVEKENAAAIADAVIRLKQEPEKRIMMGINAYNRYIENYSLPIFEKKISNIFAKLISSF